METSIFGGLTIHSHYRQVSYGLHAVLQVNELIERDAQWVVRVTVRCYIGRTSVKVHLESEVTKSH